MPISFEADGKYVSDLRLVLRGLVFVIVAAVAVVAMLARSQGRFEHTVQVTAELADVGDGLPDKSDVKYEGVLVGTVTGVTLSAAGRPDQVHIALTPHFAAEIPASVTARVVPSNVFAVPSIQLVGNGPAAALTAGARIPEDHSAATLRLQTSLDALKKIASAAGRSESDSTVGILATVEQATSGRGEAALRAAGQLSRIVQALDAAAAPDGTASTVDALSRALIELRTAAPDLLGAVHDAVVPLQAVAQERDQLTALLLGSAHTSETFGVALQHREGTLLGVTSQLGPVLDVLARGGTHFVQMTTSMTQLNKKFVTDFWDFRLDRGTAKVIVELTPHQQYTRADCPRYGALEGPSCHTAPANGPSVLSTPSAKTASAAIGGTVGPAGSAQEQHEVASLLGTPPNALADLLVGPLLRGNNVTVAPAPEAGGHR